jgi:hypothetical protein
MVARMTLEQIAAYLQADVMEAKNALNRIGICAPAGGDDSILVTSADLRRVADNLAMHRRGWDGTGEIPSERPV